LKYVVENKKDRAVPNGRTVPFGGLFLEVVYRNRVNMRSREGTLRHLRRSSSSSRSALDSLPWYGHTRMGVGTRL